MADAKRILITGAKGFVGQHLVSLLRATRPSWVLLESTADVRQATQVLAVVGETRPTHCIHLAAISSIAGAREAPAAAWDINLHGALAVAEAILAAAPACCMIFAGSADAYGASFKAGHPLDETALLAPQNLYGATKAAADLALGSLTARGLRLVRLRPFNHIGAGQSADFVVASFARQIARVAAGLQAPVLHAGRLDTCRDFLDVRDVCAAYLACVERHQALTGSAIFNLASGQARRIGDVLREMTARAGISPEIQTDVTRMRDTDIMSASGDAGRAKALLGWAPVIPWQETLATVLDDWRTRIACTAEE